jgi:hypothetical protein
MLNQLPAALKDEMQEHLRLKFNHQEASDDQVRTKAGTRFVRHFNGSASLLLVLG